jgi:hypothetical protein
VEWLKVETLSSNPVPQKKKKKERKKERKCRKSGVIAYTCNSSTQEAEAG